MLGGILFRYVSKQRHRFFSSSWKETLKSELTQKPSSELPAPNIPHTQKPKPILKPTDTRFFTYRTAFYTTAICGAVTLFWLSERKRILGRRTYSRTDEEVTGAPNLGGPWTLVDQHGNIVTSEDLKGKYQLLYFGFSFCPDICPQELEKQALVVEQLGKKFGDLIQPVFITVDPARDTVAQVRAYCEGFHPRLLGLTGTPNQVKKISRAYRVYYNPGIRTDDEDYLVDHSIIHYLVAPNGKFRDFFGKNMTASEMVRKIELIIKEDTKKQAQKIDKRAKVEDC